MQKFKICIQGKTPYMQHRMDDVTLEEWEKSMGQSVIKKLNEPDRQRTAFFGYFDEEGTPYIPSGHVKACLIMAGSFIKIKIGSTRKSMKSIVGGMMSIVPHRLPILPNPNAWEVDKRVAKNPVTKARIVVYRPRWDVWRTEFDLLVDNEEITIDILKSLFQYAGNNVGIGSYRPIPCNGECGRFGLISIDKIEENV